MIAKYRVVNSQKIDSGVTMEKTFTGNRQKERKDMKSFLHSSRLFKPAVFSHAKTVSNNPDNNDNFAIFRPIFIFLFLASDDEGLYVISCMVLRVSMPCTILTQQPSQSFLAGSVVQLKGSAHLSSS